MLRDLTIKNYRCFKDFSIDGLARVNLIVGQNNSGKTSFLEAVYLLVNQQNPFSLLELLCNRGEYGEVVDIQREFIYQFTHIFHNHQPNPQLESSIQIESHSENTLVAKVRLLTTKEFNGRSAVSPYRLQFRYSNPEYPVSESEVEEGINLPLAYDFAFRNSFTSSVRQPGPHQFVAARHLDFPYLTKLWNQIITSPHKEDLVVQGLRILEPQLVDFRFTSQPTAGGVLVNLGNQQTRLPLSSMGDGMRRILTLSMSAVAAEQGVLLVDEIDTGLYHGTQTHMWQLLIEMAQQLNVQIFATTHSWDCVRAFQEALEATDQSLGLLFRLDRQFGQIRPVKYEAGELAIAVREAIEVR